MKLEDYGDSKERSFRRFDLQIAALVSLALYGCDESGTTEGSKKITNFFLKTQLFWG